MSDTQHTPGPWSLEYRRWITSGDVYIARIHDVSKIGEGEAVANAEFIIQACNSHDALLEVLESLMDVEGVEPSTSPLQSYRDPDAQAEAERVWQQAFDAIAKARGGA